MKPGGRFTSNKVKCSNKTCNKETDKLVTFDFGPITIKDVCKECSILIPHGEIGYLF